MIHSQDDVGSNILNPKSKESGSYLENQYLTCRLTVQIFSWGYEFFECLDYPLIKGVEVVFLFVWISELSGLKESLKELFLTDTLRNLLRVDTKLTFLSWTTLTFCSPSSYTHFSKSLLDLSHLLLEWHLVELSLSNRSYQNYRSSNFAYSPNSGRLPVETSVVRP